MTGRDAVLILHSALTRPGTPMYARVGPRVWAQRPPSSSIWDNDAPAVVFNITRDTSAGQGEVRFRCYGGSGKDIDARNTHGALYASMHGTFHRCRHGTLVYCFYIGGTPDVVEPDTGYPVTIGNFTFHIV